MSLPFSPHSHIPARTGEAPRLVQKDGRFALPVDGHPYLILGGQIHNSSAWPSELPRSGNPWPPPNNFAFIDFMSRETAQPEFEGTLKAAVEEPGQATQELDFGPYEFLVTGVDAIVTFHLPGKSAWIHSEIHSAKQGQNEGGIWRTPAPLKMRRNLPRLWFNRKFEVVDLHLSRQVQLWPSAPFQIFPGDRLDGGNGVPPGMPFWLFSVCLSRSGCPAHHAFGATPLTAHGPAPKTWPKSL